MQIPVWIEPKPGSGFRATSSMPFPLTAEGGTEAEALSRLQALLRDRVERGGRLVSVEASQAINAELPWMQFAGDLKEEPLFAEWQEAIRENRCQADETEQTR